MSAPIAEASFLRAGWGWGWEHGGGGETDIALVGMTAIDSGVCLQIAS